MLHGRAGGWLLMLHGEAKIGVSHQGSARGVTKFESQNWIMPMATRRVGREAHETNLAKDAEIVVYCVGPHCPQSGYAAEKLQALGYMNVRAFEGGLEEWKGLGREVELTGEPVAA